MAYIILVQNGAANIGDVIILGALVVGMFFSTAFLVQFAGLKFTV